MLRSIFESKYPLACGIIIAFSGFVMALSSVDRETAVTVFLFGWFIAVLAGVVRILLAPTSISKPLKIIALGFALVAASGIPEFLGAAPLVWLFYIGLVTMVVGILSGIWQAGVDR